MSAGKMFGELTEEAQTSEDADRDSDIELLESLVENDEIHDDRREAFEDMLKGLRSQFRCLTKRQREFAESVASDHGISFSRRIAETAANVPRGREVAVPDVLSRDSLRAALDARKGRR